MYILRGTPGHPVITKYIVNNNFMNQEYVSTPFNFCGLSPELSSFENSRVIILPVPYDLTTSYLSGTRHGPLAIINASTHLELFDDEIKREVALIGIHTLPAIETVTSGPADMIQQVETACAQMVNTGKFPVLLGGEHSITLGMVQALNKKYRNIGVLQLDAHADLRDSYQGSPYNHACIGRRIHEHCLLTQAGIRSLSAEEFEFLSDTNISTFFADYIKNNKGWVDEVIERLPQDIYVSIDLDVFDPSIMPSVGTPEPGGLDWHEMLRLLRTVSKKRHIVGFDIVELCPQPTNPGPDFLAAKLCYKLLGYIYYP